MNLLAQSIVFAGILAAVNIIAAMIAIHFALRQNEIKKFLEYVLVSMAVRMLGMLCAVWYGLKVWNLHIIAFPFTLLSLYLISTSIEIVGIHLRQVRKERTHTQAERM